MRSKITLRKTKECDVFVMGCGIAGIMSAIQASENGAKVIISSSSCIFSGSSFYPGTWGLGVIGPEDKNDESNLADTIKKVGEYTVDDDLVEVFVKNISKSIKILKSMGVKLKKATNSNEKEFIPCFDYRNRAWNGIEFESAKKIFEEKLDDNGVTKLPFSQVIDIIKHKDKIIGVVLINSNNKFEFIKCKSVIIASGGIGGIFKHRLNTNDITGMGQSLALELGCKLVNIEFMQIMPGYINPCPKTIFNEKVFKYVEIRNQQGKNILENIENYEEKLEERSTHGPFTSRLSSRDIDYKIFEEFIKDQSGIRVKYKDEIRENQTEFIKIYFKWLEEKKNLTIDDEINIGIFFHASNGGIKIDKEAKTGVEGLFAAGEATGGMHGADRIGGLSTANGLVFGIIAGSSASKYALNLEENNVDEIEFYPYQVENAEKYIREIQEIMFKSAMIEKNENTVLDAISRLTKISDNLMASPEINMESISESYILKGNLILANSVLKAIELRKESRGSHYRNDYPSLNENMNKMIGVEKKGDIRAYFE